MPESEWASSKTMGCVGSLPAKIRVAQFVWCSEACRRLGVQLTLYLQFRERYRAASLVRRTSHAPRFFGHFRQ
jgi:hypothetical protein